MNRFKEEFASYVRSQGNHRLVNNPKHFAKICAFQFKQAKRNNFGITAEPIMDFFLESSGLIASEEKTWNRVLMHTVTVKLQNQKRELQRLISVRKNGAIKVQEAGYFSQARKLGCHTDNFSEAIEVIIANQMNNIRWTMREASQALNNSNRVASIH